MKKLWNEFKAFAFKGNVLDLAVGMIIGASFTAIVTALVNSVFMPLLSLVTGKLDFNAMKWTIKTGSAITYLEDGTEVVEDHLTEIPYGAFLQAIFVFVFTAFCLFLVIKGINKVMSLKKKEEEPKEPPRLCPYCFQEVHKEATRCPHCTSELIIKLDK
ncbi:MAG: large conductance mechanosensitive channel protein MscL [Clostridia bacterium]|nr:large conductance mechanosensitive channel protein MscL [Clostridia bacterium]MBR5986854.1 large conductance mechanosensitive channel protein MscL [Clostridia bacterium]MBR6008233.1 large conductance mechanosensitive channel protein MscL [Clostridia bacterium]